MGKSKYLLHIDRMEEIVYISTKLFIKSGKKKTIKHSIEVYLDYVEIP